LVRRQNLFGAFRKINPFKKVESPFAVTGPYKQVSPLFPNGFAESGKIKVPRVIPEEEEEREEETLDGNAPPNPGFKTSRFCKLFIDAGADVNARDKNGCSVLETLVLAQIQRARKFEDFQALLELLIAAQVDVNAADQNGWTPLFYLLFYSFCDRQEYEKGLKEADIQAIAEKKIGLFKMLIDAGADAKAADKKGNTLLHYIVLPPYNATIEHWDINLGYETRGNHRLFSRLLIEFLVEKGASLSDKNNDGETPLDWATQGSSQHRGGGRGSGMNDNDAFRANLINPVLPTPMPDEQQLQPRQKAADALNF